jgi:hypothetical protein
MTQKYDMTIGGKTLKADSYTDIQNPANTKQVVGQAPVGTAKHLDQAIAAAQKTFQSWRFSSDEDRVGACGAIAKVVTDNADELAVLLTKEQGKPLGGLGSRFELGGCGAWAPGRERTLCTQDAVSRRHHARDLRARGLYSATRRAGAKTPSPFDEVSRRVRAGEPRPGTDCAQHTLRRCH